MKTTLNIPDELWQQLNIEAAERKQKGFSGIVAEILRAHFQNKTHSRETDARKKRKKIAADLFGSITSSQADAERSALKESRRLWKPHS